MVGVVVWGVECGMCYLGGEVADEGSPWIGRPLFVRVQNVAKIN